MCLIVWMLILISPILTWAVQLVHCMSMRNDWHHYGRLKRPLRAILRVSGPSGKCTDLHVFDHSQLFLLFLSSICFITTADGDVVPSTTPTTCAFANSCTNARPWKRRNGPTDPSAVAGIALLRWPLSLGVVAVPAGTGSWSLNRLNTDTIPAPSSCPSQDSLSPMQITKTLSGGVPDLIRWWVVASVRRAEPWAASEAHRKRWRDGSNVPRWNIFHRGCYSNMHVYKIGIPCRGKRRCMFWCGRFNNKAVAWRGPCTLIRS